jgi:hypothetical protein
MMLPPSEAYAGPGLGEFTADIERQLRLAYRVPSLGSLGQEEDQQLSWWQGLLYRITDIVGRRIGPAPGTYQRTPSGELIVRQPSGYTGPVQVPVESIVRGQLAARSDTGTGLILAAVGVGVLVLLMTRR